MTGNVPEEDGVDHRVEPSMWLSDGSGEGDQEAAEPEQLTPVDPADDASPLLPGDSVADEDPILPDMPLPAAGSFYTDTGSFASDGYDSTPDDELRIPPYQPQVPPYPAQVSPYPAPAVPAASSSGVGSKVTAPFSALTKSKTRKPASPPRPDPPAGPGFPVGSAAATGPVASGGLGMTMTAERVAVAPRPAAPKGPPTRRAQLVLTRIEPWSVMKFSFMISLVGWVVLFVAVAALYYVLNKLGVFHAIQTTITNVTSSKDTTGDDANGAWFSASRILGYTMLVGAVNVVLITALATVGAVIYNLVTHLAGGIEVTLKETD
jgi:hypothetical protein